MWVKLVVSISSLLSSRELFFRSPLPSPSSLSPLSFLSLSVYLLFIFILNNISLPKFANIFLTFPPIIITDVKDIRFVINYDMPTEVESYIHRIGRTGRAGATGEAHSFFTHSDAKLARELIRILREANQVIPPELEQLSRSSFGGSSSRYRGGGGGGYRGGYRGGYGGGRGGYGSGGFSASGANAIPSKTRF